MGDCPGAGSGDPSDYEQRSSEQIADDKYRRFERWVRSKGFTIEAWRMPVAGEYFVPDDETLESKRKILKAEWVCLYGTTKVVPLNFVARRNYYVLKKGKSTED